MGGVVDTGATTSCIGLAQARAYCAMTRQKLRLVKPTVRMRFGSGSSTPLGVMNLLWETPRGIAPIQAHVVQNDVPLLIGLDYLDQHSIYLRNTKSKLECEDGWSAPTEKAAGHHWQRHGLVQSALTEIMYTKSQLSKLHRHFRRPGPGRLYDLLRRSRATDLEPGAMAILKEIADECKVCAQIRNKEITFRGRLSEGVVFNRKLLLDLMYLDGRPVLHVVDKDTNFGAARFVQTTTKNPTTDEVWTCFLQAWALVYTGLPDVVHTDAGSCFTSKPWEFMMTANRIEHVVSGVESHHSLGSGEQAHHPLRRIYYKVRLDHPKMSQALALQLARKAMNETSGPNGLIPLLLVSGLMPSYRHVGLSDHTENKVRFQAMLTARNEYLRHVNDTRVNRMLGSAVPSACDRKLSVGQLAYVWREGNKRYNGPYTVLNVNGDNSVITLDDRSDPRGGRFSADCVRPAPAESDTFLAELAPLLEPYLSDATRASQARDSRRTAGEYSLENNPGEESVFVTEVIPTSDTRANSSEAQAAKVKELSSLIRRGTFRVVLRNELPPSSSLMKSRILLTLKHKDTDEEMYKARFIVRGFSDPFKTKIIHHCPNIRQENARLLLSLAAICGFEVWSLDVSQAYLQSTTENMRSMHIEAPSEMELSSEEVLELLLPLYGACDSGDRWAHTLRHHHTTDLGMQTLATEPALFFKCFEKRLLGLSGVYTDDMLRAGDRSFAEVSQKTSKRFDTSPPKTKASRFAGIDLEQTDEGIAADMDDYIRQLNVGEQTWKVFASLRQKLAWIVYVRPDICAQVAKLAQVTPKMFGADSQKYLTSASSTVQYLKDHKLHLKYPKFDKNTLRIRAYSDASHASNADGSSQLGYIICLQDDTDRFAIIKYRSAKCHRVTRSAMSAESCAFADCYDAAYVLKTELEMLLHQDVPLQMLVDSKQLFDAISHSTRTKEQRVMIDINAAKQGFERKEISDLGLVTTDNMLADCLTKAMKPRQLVQAIRSGVIRHPVSNWIVRD